MVSKNRYCFVCLLADTDVAVTFRTHIYRTLEAEKEEANDNNNTLATQNDTKIQENHVL